MASQDLFFRQLYILFGVCIFIVVLKIVNCVEFQQDRSLRQLYWANSSLIFSEATVKHYKTNKSTFIPAHIRPMFFQPIPINDANFHLLITVPGVGPKLANEIEDTKKRIGKFENVEDLLLVSGIGEKKKQIFKNYFSF